MWISFCRLLQKRRHLAMSILWKNVEKRIHFFIHENEDFVTTAHKVNHERNLNWKIFVKGPTSKQRNTILNYYETWARFKVNNTIFCGRVRKNCRYSENWRKWYVRSSSSSKEDSSAKRKYPKVKLNLCYGSGMVCFRKPCSFKTPKKCFNYGKTGLKQT